MSIMIGCGEPRIISQDISSDLKPDGPVYTVGFGYNGFFYTGGVETDKEATELIHKWLLSQRNGWVKSNRVAGGSLCISGDWFQLNIGESVMTIGWSVPGKDDYHYWEKPVPSDINELEMVLKKWRGRRSIPLHNLKANNAQQSSQP